MQIRTILAAVADPAHERQPSVERAAQLAVALSARVVLFHAAFEPALSGRPFFDSRRLAKSRGWLVAERTRLMERRAAELGRQGVEATVVVVWEEPVHEAIVRAALRDQVDLVVAGRHQRRTDRAPTLRLTDWELMRICPRPLLLVGASPVRRGSGSIVAALDPMHAYDKPASLDIAIARAAARLAQALQLECHAVHCISESVYPFGDATPENRRRLRLQIASRMQRVMKKGGKLAANVHVVRGNAATGLPLLVDRLCASILVMGIVSRRWMKHFVIGDTAESIIRATSCDLLLVKPDNFRLRLGRARKQAIVLPKKA
jgi:universal stress protein E